MRKKGRRGKQIFPVFVTRTVDIWDGFVNNKKRRKIYRNRGEKKNL
jgi:hypothetical protein